MRVYQSVLLGLFSILAANAALADGAGKAAPVPADVVERGGRAIQKDIVGLIRASESPWNIDDPTKDTLFIEPATGYPRVLAITRKLGIPHKRIFVNLVMPYGSQSDGYNAMISGELAQDATELRLAFTVAHEYAHGFLNHRLTASIDAYREQLAYCPACTDPKDLVATVKAGFDNPDLTAFRERIKRLELDADEWAARQVARNYSVPSAASLLSEVVESENYSKDDEGETHYSRNRRLAAIAAVLESSSR
ncbi:hypothetical protein [Aromatoleum petrolei]|nr:hypothetical protein [Aromatoleum petrolei]QTQ38388.1 Uncharacterized protein ToN1_42890 [Aromatoleum petrolei]